MNQKALTVIIVVLLVGAAVAYALTRTAPPAVAPTQQDATTENGAPTAAGAQGSGAYRWEFADAGEDAETGAPRTRVTLVTDGQRRDLGTFQGSCSVLAEDRLLEEEKAGVLCWFAGGGDEIGVFEENGKLVVKRGVQDEGSAESPGFRGDFKTVLAL